jgi:hypothetical protein
MILDDRPASAELRCYTTLWDTTRRRFVRFQLERRAPPN